MADDYFAGPRPRIFGHRGAAGAAPENTLPSFRRALDDGAEILELDVHATRDGVVVVIHDPTVERTTDGHGAVRDLTLADLQRLDAGHAFARDGGFPFRASGIRVPTFAEVIEEFPSVPLNVEIKQRDPEIEAVVAALLARHGAVKRVMLAAENDLVMQRIRTAAPDSPTSLSAAETAEFFQRSFEGRLNGYHPPGRALQVPARFGEYELVTPGTVADAHRFDLEIHVWTINDPAEMERLLRLGVDGVMSDFPRRLRDVTVRHRSVGG